jgi:hypothetical protein
VIRVTSTGRTGIAENRPRRDAWLARAVAAVPSSEGRDPLIRAGGLERLADRTGEGDPEGV